MPVMPPKSVLLVEDNELLRECLCEMLGEMLGEAGWQVAGAAGAAEALDRMDRDPKLWLITSARRRWPHLRTVLMSGADVSKLTVSPGDLFLSKPFLMDALVQAVTEVVAQLTSSDCCTAAGP